MLLAGGCKDPCKDTLCDNGTCLDEGICECNAGYEGPTCSVKITEKYLGTFDASETCDSGPTDYIVNITEDNLNDGQLIFDDIYASGRAVNVIALDSTLSIPTQPIGNGTIEGDGAISSDLQMITINFSVETGPLIDNCSVIFTRQ